MKIRRTNSKSYSSRNFSSFQHPCGDSRPRDGHASLGSRLRVASFYLTVFISGCLLTGFLLSMSPQQSLERSSSRLMLQHPAGSVHRRGLYTAGTGGKWHLGVIQGYTEPSRPRIGLVDRSNAACARILAVGALIGASHGPPACIDRLGTLFRNSPALLGRCWCWEGRC
jgi:hypothetical protein